MAPSLPIPVSTTPTPSFPAAVAMLPRRTSPDGRWRPATVRLSKDNRPVAASLRCAPSGAIQAPWLACAPAAANTGGQPHDLVEPADQSFGDPRRDVLHDQERDRVVGRERVEQAGQDLRATCRRAHADHGRAVPRAARVRRAGEPGARMADHVGPAEHPDPMTERSTPRA